MSCKKKIKLTPVVPPRIPTPMPPPQDGTLYSSIRTARVVASDYSNRAIPNEALAMQSAKTTMPKMDKNGYFHCISSTAKKKKISLMQPKPPRVAFMEEGSRGREGSARECRVSQAATAATDSKGPMSHRVTYPAPRAYVDSQLECYQPRYHHIRDVKEFSANARCAVPVPQDAERKSPRRSRTHQLNAPPAQQLSAVSRTKPAGSPHRRRRSADEETAAGAGGFCGALQRAQPPPPPALLRRLGVKETTGVGKVKVMLRVAGDEASCGSTFSMDKRKRQVTLCEQASTSAQPDDRRLTVAAPKMFAFDAIFSNEDSQTEICSNALTDVIHAVINGTDGCLFCFGQAGLGKSYTMTGRPDSVNNLGVIPCAISWLFRGIAEQRHKCGTKFSVRVSAVELCTNTNQIRDLLSTYHGDSELAPGVYLKDDPLFGTSLQNHSELRVHSPEKAAYYLDAAVATRTALREEGKDSHLLFTLHVYQYSVSTKGPVAGGRSRLHLIDLGNCERGKSGSGISLSGLGNILLAIFNGQRHLPFRDHSLTHVLRECLGSLTCHTAIIVHVSPKDNHYSDTLTTLQLASRIHRLRRRKIKFPSANNQGSGGSSGEDAKPSSSEPDPSSSDLSCDTVIYVGPLDEATDGEHPPVYIPSINSGDNRCVMSKALRGTAAEHRHKSSLARVVEEKCEKSPVHKFNLSPRMMSLRSINTISPAYSQKSSPIHNVSSKSTPVKKKPQGDDSVMKTPVHQNFTNPSTSDEQWIDGPRFPKYKLVEARQIIKETQQVTKKETWIDGPLKETKIPVPFSAIPAQSGNIPPQINMLVSQNSESLGYGYMDNHKKNMIRKWVENQTSQIIHKSRHDSPSHKGHQAQHKESSPYKTSETQDVCGLKFEVSSRNTKNLHVEESRIRTGLKAGSKSSSIIEENLDKDNIESCMASKKSTVKITAKNDEEDDDSEELAEIPPALPLIQTLSSREVSMESLDSRLKERLRMNDELTSNQSREINSNANSTGHFIDDDDEILEIIEIDEPIELVPMQDSCLQVTEEDIAFCMGLSENPLPEVDQSDDEHPLRILSQENLTVASTFTDTMSLYSDVERQIRKEAYLRQAYDIYYGDLHFPDLVEQVNLHDNYSSPRHRTETQYGINYFYNSPSQNELSEEVSSPKATPLQFQSLSMSNVRDVEDYHGDGSVYSEPAYRPSDTICNSCKRTLSRPGSAIDHQDPLSTTEHEDSFGPYERYRNTEGTDARIASLRHPDGASDPNLREEKRSPAIGSSAPPPYRDALKASFHLEVTTAVTSQPQPEKTEKLERSCVAKVIAGSKPDGYDSGHESTPRTGKHSPAATSRRAESGYDSVPRDSDASSLDSYPTRRAAAARAHAKKQTTAKYKQHNDRSFCAWLRNPFACKYADTDPEISDF